MKMVMNILKWVLAIIFFHPFMVIASIMLLFMPFIIYADIKRILTYEVPMSISSLAGLSILTFVLYLAVRIRFLGSPYRKITILLPLLQMCVYTSVALVTGLEIINKWADGALFNSKEVAVWAMLLTIAVLRLGMSILYWKYPIVQRNR